MTYADEIIAIVESFEYETCEECGRDLDAHVLEPDLLGHVHVTCILPDPYEVES